MPPSSVFTDHLGIVRGEAGGGQAELLLEPRAEHLNSLGATHGGVVVTLMDAAMAASARSLPHGTQMVLAKGEELFAEGDDAEFFYEVVSGSIRSYKLLSDGRRQIDAFHLQGDIFGLEAGSEHRFSAEAVGDVTVIAYRRSRRSTRL